MHAYIQSELIGIFVTEMSSKDARGSNVKILGGAVVCNECELKGDITIGARTVIHPKARIIAESGPIIIGELDKCTMMNGVMN